MRGEKSFVGVAMLTYLCIFKDCFKYQRYDRL